MREAKWFTAHRLLLSSRGILQCRLGKLEQFYSIMGLYVFLVHQQIMTVNICHTETQKAPFFPSSSTVSCQSHTSCVALPVFLLYKGVSFVRVRMALLSVVAMETVQCHNEMMNYSVSRELPVCTRPHPDIYLSMCAQERSREGRERAQ